MQLLSGPRMEGSCRTLLDAYARAWRDAGSSGQYALTDGNVTLAYPELYAQVAGMAGRLRSAGIVPGRFVLLAMERSLASVVNVLAIMAAGACPCPLDTRLSDDEIADRIRIAGVDAVLCDAMNRERFARLAVRRVLASEQLEDAPPYWHEGHSPNDPGLLLFTSGSTGRPKGVVLGHGGLLNNAVGIAAVTRLSPQDSLLHVMPLNHTNGLCNQVLSPLLAGATICLAGRFRAESMPALMSNFRPTIVTAVPTMYARMLKVEFPPSALASLRIARCGSAPLQTELQQRIEHHLGCPLIVSYGLSEATCTSVMNPVDARKIGSIGKPMPNQRVFLARADGSMLAEPGAVGEICIAGSSLMLGYVGAEQDGVLQPADSVLRTGDLGRFDEDGYVYITGRLKDIIIRGGENIFPAQIESAVAGHAGVEACCVVAQAHADLGEVPVAFVVARRGCVPTKEDINQLVSSRLTRTHQLHDVFFMDALPENTIGKIDRKALTALASRDRHTL